MAQVVEVVDRHVAIDRDREHAAAAVCHVEQRLDVTDVGVIADHVARRCCVRPDHRHRCGAAQRQHTVVAQQHQAVGRDPAGEGELLWCAGVLAGAGGVDARVGRTDRAGTSTRAPAPPRDRHRRSSRNRRSMRRAGRRRNSRCRAARRRRPTSAPGPPPRGLMRRRGGSPRADGPRSSRTRRCRRIPTRRAGARRAATRLAPHGTPSIS